MYILVSYDIVDNRKRLKVLKFLKDYGYRVQKSVFECNLDKNHYIDMKNGIEKLIDKKKDRVRYYKLCKVCVGRIQISGWGEIREDEDFEII